MDKVCAIVCSSDLLVGEEVYIHELGHMGMGIGDRLHTRIYNLGRLNSVRNNRDATAFASRKNGISLDQVSRCHAWFTVFQHLKEIWDEYNSERSTIDVITSTETFATETESPHERDAGLISLEQQFNKLSKETRTFLLETFSMQTVQWLSSI